jgi:SAM-dependent methyltransferase
MTRPRVTSPPAWELVDAGDHRVLTVEGRAYTTGYSARVVRLLVERKGPHRAPLYFPLKETRAPRLLGPLFGYLRRGRPRTLRVLEVGCSFGHLTEYLADQPEVAQLWCLETDPTFAAIVRLKTQEQRLTAVRDVACLTGEETCRLPYPDGAFDLVLAVGVIEHLPARFRRRQVDEYYRVLAAGGHIAVLDTPNRAFPLETHSVGLPLVQWLPPRLAWRYARALRRARFRDVPFEEFAADGTGWRNASLAECLPSTGGAGLEDVTEEAGYGWRYFRDTARSRTRRALMPLFAAAVAVARAAGRPASVCLPYLNLLLRRAGTAGGPAGNGRRA